MAVRTGHGGHHHRAGRPASRYGRRSYRHPSGRTRRVRQWSPEFVDGDRTGGLRAVMHQTRMATAVASVRVARGLLSRNPESPRRSQRPRWPDSGHAATERSGNHLFGGGVGDPGTATSGRKARGRPAISACPITTSDEHPARPSSGDRTVRHYRPFWPPAAHQEPRSDRTRLPAPGQPARSREQSAHMPPPSRR
jgi:hypothetical protein